MCIFLHYGCKIHVELDKCLIDRRKKSLLLSEIYKCNTQGVFKTEGN